MTGHNLTNDFQQASHDTQLVIIEGMQALKHVVRFGGDIQKIVSCDIQLLTKLLNELAPDTKELILSNITEVTDDVFNKLSPRPIRTKTIAIAKKPLYTLTKIDTDKPIVLLENPRDLGNIGAVVRVAAGANAGAVITTGDTNIWHPLAIRGGAGLQFALPVFSFGSTDEILPKLANRQLISLDPEGENIKTIDIPKNAILVFGTERGGISQEVLKKSDQIVRLPMRVGVSSLNLATSVAATLYQL